MSLLRAVHRDTLGSSVVKGKIDWDLHVVSSNPLNLIEAVVLLTQAATAHCLRSSYVHQRTLWRRNSSLFQRFAKGVTDLSLYHVLGFPFGAGATEESARRSVIECVPNTLNTTVVSKPQRSLAATLVSSRVTEHM